jgi:hypothetical protein
MGRGLYIIYNIYIDPRAYFACFQHEFETFCNEVPFRRAKTRRVTPQKLTTRGHYSI